MSGVYGPFVPQRKKNQWWHARNQEYPEALHDSPESGIAFKGDFNYEDGTHSRKTIGQPDSKLQLLNQSDYQNNNYYPSNSQSQRNQCLKRNRIFCLVLRKIVDSVRVQQLRIAFQRMERAERVKVLTYVGLSKLDALAATIPMKQAFRKINELAFQNHNKQFSKIPSNTTRSEDNNSGQFVMLNQQRRKQLGSSLLIHRVYSLIDRKQAQLALLAMLSIYASSNNNPNKQNSRNYMNNNCNLSGSLLQPTSQQQQYPSRINISTSPAQKDPRLSTSQLSSLSPAKEHINPSTQLKYNIQNNQLNQSSQLKYPQQPQITISVSVNSDATPPRAVVYQQEQPQLQNSYYRQSDYQQQQQNISNTKPYEQQQPQQQQSKPQYYQLQSRMQPFSRNQAQQQSSRQGGMLNPRQNNFAQDSSLQESRIEMESSGIYKPATPLKSQLGYDNNHTPLKKAQPSSSRNYNESQQAYPAGGATTIDSSISPSPNRQSSRSPHGNSASPFSRNLNIISERRRKLHKQKSKGKQLSLLIYLASWVRRVQKSYFQDIQGYYIPKISNFSPVKKATVQPTTPQYLDSSQLSSKSQVISQIPSTPSKSQSQNTPSRINNRQNKFQPGNNYLPTLNSSNPSSAPATPKTPLRSLLRTTPRYENLSNNQAYLKSELGAQILARTLYQVQLRNLSNSFVRIRGYVYDRRVLTVKFNRILQIIEQTRKSQMTQALIRIQGEHTQKKHRETVLESMRELLARKEWKKIRWCFLKLQRVKVRGNSIQYLALVLQRVLTKAQEIQQRYALDMIFAWARQADRVGGNMKKVKDDTVENNTRNDWYFSIVDDNNMSQNRRLDVPKIQYDKLFTSIDLICNGIQRLVNRSLKDGLLQLLKNAENHRQQRVKRIQSWSNVLDILAKKRLLKLSWIFTELENQFKLVQLVEKKNQSECKSNSTKQRYAANQIFRVLSRIDHSRRVLAFEKIKRKNSGIKQGINIINMVINRKSHKDLFKGYQELKLFSELRALRYQHQQTRRIRQFEHGLFRILEVMSQVQKQHKIVAMQGIIHRFKVISQERQKQQIFQCFGITIKQILQKNIDKTMKYAYQRIFGQRNKKLIIEKAMRNLSNFSKRGVMKALKERYTQEQRLKELDNYGVLNKISNVVSKAKLGLQRLGFDAIRFQLSKNSTKLLKPLLRQQLILPKVLCKLVNVRMQLGRKAIQDESKVKSKKLLAMKRMLVWTNRLVKGQISGCFRRLCETKHELIKSRNVITESGLLLSRVLFRKILKVHKFILTQAFSEIVTYAEKIQENRLKFNEIQQIKLQGANRLIGSLSKVNSLLISSKMAGLYALKDNSLNGIYSAAYQQVQQSHEVLTQQMKELKMNIDKGSKVIMTIIKRTQTRQLMEGFEVMKKSTNKQKGIEQMFSLSDMIVQRETQNRLKDSLKQTADYIHGIRRNEVVTVLTEKLTMMIVKSTLYVKHMAIYAIKDKVKGIQERTQQRVAAIGVVMRRQYLKSLIQAFLHWREVNTIYQLQHDERNHNEQEKQDKQSQDELIDDVQSFFQQRRQFDSAIETAIQRSASSHLGNVSQQIGVQQQQQQQSDQVFSARNAYQKRVSYDTVDFEFDKYQEFLESQHNGSENDKQNRRNQLFLSQPNSTVKYVNTPSSNMQANPGRLIQSEKGFNNNTSSNRLQMRLQFEDDGR